MPGRIRTACSIATDKAFTPPIIIRFGNFSPRAFKPPLCMLISINLLQHIRKRILRCISTSSTYLSLLSLNLWLFALGLGIENGCFRDETPSSTFTLICLACSTLAMSRHYPECRSECSQQDIWTSAFFHVCSLSTLLGTLHYWCNYPVSQPCGRSLEILQMLVRSFSSRQTSQIVTSARLAHPPTRLHLHRLPLKSCMKYKVLLFTYKSLHVLALRYLSDLLHPYNPSRNLRSSNTSAGTYDKVFSVAATTHRISLY